MKGNNSLAQSTSNILLFYFMKFSLDKNAHLENTGLGVRKLAIPSVEEKTMPAITSTGTVHIPVTQGTKATNVTLASTL